MITSQIIQTLKSKGFGSVVAPLERQFANDADEAYRYAEWVLNNTRFKLGEPAISRNKRVSYYYYFNIAQPNPGTQTTGYLEQIEENAWDYHRELRQSEEME